METSLTMALTERESLAQGDDVDLCELERTLQCLQIATILGVYGIVAPPLRAWCLPTLHEPGSSCPRQICVEDEGIECPGNHWERENEHGFTLIWRHYKNADKGGFVGECIYFVHCSVHKIVACVAYYHVHMSYVLSVH